MKRIRRGILIVSILVLYPHMTAADGSDWNSGSGGWATGYDLSNVSGSFIGENAGDTAGFSVAGVGDVNGDGYEDLAIGASSNDDGGAGAGKAYLILGKESGWAMDTGLADADASFIGENAGDSADIVGGGGDVNGDGYRDLLIGAWNNSDGGLQAGKAYLILGKATGWARNVDLANADASFIGENAVDWAGSAVANAGDVNGDGFDDILIGAPGYGPVVLQQGKVYLILGKAAGWAVNVDLANSDASYTGEGVIEFAGTSVSVGDINGDGLSDFMTGAPQNDDGGADAGKAYLILGKAAGWVNNVDLGNSDASYIGSAAGDNAGICVSNVGDIDNDGNDDFKIGADGTSGNTGSSYLIPPGALGGVISLSTFGTPFSGEAANNHAGFSAAGLGDINNDGYDDVIIGAPGNGDEGAEAGKAYVLLGGTAADITADASFVGEETGDMAGWITAGADVNGDGLGDIIIGAHRNDEGGVDAGQVYVIILPASSAGEDGDEDGNGGDDNGDTGNNITPTGYAMGGGRGCALAPAAGPPDLLAFLEITLSIVILSFSRIPRRVSG